MPSPSAKYGLGTIPLGLSFTKVTFLQDTGYKKLVKKENIINGHNSEMDGSDSASGRDGSNSGSPSEMDGSDSEAKIQPKPNPISPSFTLGMDGSDSASGRDGSNSGSASEMDRSDSEAKIQPQPNPISPSYTLGMDGSDSSKIY